MFGKMVRFLFDKRPEINEQNTGRMAYQQSMGYAPVSNTGVGGQMVLRTIDAFQPANIAVGPTLKLVDPSVTGNNAYGLTTQPLSENDPFGSRIQQI